MKRLVRETSYDQQTNHEVRIQQLERRFIDVPTHWALARFTASQSISSGGNIITWEHFRTTNPDIFSTSASVGGAISNTAGDNSIRLDFAGIVLVSGWVRWTSGTYYRISVVNVLGSETDAITNYLDINNRSSWNPTSTDDNGSPMQTSDDQWFQCGANSSPSWFSIQANVAGINRNAIGGSLSVVLWRPSGVLYDDTVVY